VEAHEPAARDDDGRDAVGHGVAHLEGDVTIPVAVGRESERHLDPRTRGEMWQTIRELVAGGATVLLTTQYLDEADQLADRVAVIDKGRKVAEGTPEELKANVGSATLHLTMSEPREAPRALQLLEGTLARSPLLNPEQGRLTIAMDDADEAASVFIALREAGISVESLGVQRPTLDEVFLALTGEQVSDADAEHSNNGQSRSAQEAR